MMCVTEQYVIFGLSQCQGQGDIWHLLLEHVVTMVSVSAVGVRARKSQWQTVGVTEMTKKECSFPTH